MSIWRVSIINLGSCFWLYCQCRQLDHNNLTEITKGWLYRFADAAGTSSGSECYQQDQPWCLGVLPETQWAVSSLLFSAWEQESCQSMSFLALILWNFLITEFPRWQLFSFLVHMQPSIVLVRSWSWLQLQQLPFQFCGTGAKAMVVTFSNKKILITRIRNNVYLSIIKKEEF